MIVTKWIEVEQEVEVSISSDDIAAELAQSNPENIQAMLRGLNNCAAFMKAIPDSLIAETTEAQRGYMKDFLTQQLARYNA